MTEIIFLFIAFVATIIASYTDIKTREVPDWLNYSLIATGLGLRAIYSLYYGVWGYIVAGVIGLAVLFGIGYIMFYSGQWGGGDSKYIMGIGALLGIHFNLHDFTVGFLVNTFLLGAVYGIIWSAALAVKHYASFRKEWHSLRTSKELHFPRIALLIIALLAIIGGFILHDIRIRFILLSIVFFLFILFYTFIFTKSVERSCMQKLVNPGELTEGDWIVKDVIVGKKKICGPKDLGVSKEQIAELIHLQKKGKIKKVLMKVGIPFVPSFLIALIVTWFGGNLLLNVFRVFS